MKQAILMLAVALTSCGNPPTSPRYGSVEAEAMKQPAAARAEAPSTVGRPEVFRGAFDIQPALESFRSTLGTLNPNQPGSFGNGRREINWDAVPSQFTNTDDFPRDFFNQPVTGRARGALFTTPGTGFRVSDNDLADVNGT